MKPVISSIFVVLALLVIFPCNALAVDYKIANQMTLEWAVTAPVNAGEQIEYAIYIAPSTDKPAATKLWQGPEVQYTVTLTTEGLFLFGLQTVRLVDIGGTMTVVSQAPIGWSDDPLIAPTPFGAQHFLPPPAGSGFQPQP
jgi:hypothetical protein